MRQVPGATPPPPFPPHPNGMVPIWWPSPRSGKRAPKSQIPVVIRAENQPQKSPKKATNKQNHAQHKPKLSKSAPPGAHDHRGGRGGAPQTMTIPVGGGGTRGTRIIYMIPVPGPGVPFPPHMVWSPSGGPAPGQEKGPPNSRYQG